MSNALWPHGLLHARLPCPSPSPRACSSSGPLSWWCIQLSRLLSSSPPFHLSAAAESLQLCLTLCDPIHGSPPGSPVPGILQARTLEWVTISFSNAWKWKVKVKSLSRVRLSATPWTAAHQAPPPMEFSRQGYWSGLPLPSPLLSLYVLLNQHLPICQPILPNLITAVSWEHRVMSDTYWVVEWWELNWQYL